MKWLDVAGALILGAGLAAQAADPMLAGNIDRPLRYHPEGRDFVITNSTECFNRPLYGGNTAFRVDAGDVPEFSFYLPGHGGNVRFGIRSAGQAKWLNAAARVVARYRPGSMIHEIRDPLLGDGVLTLTAVAPYDREGLIVRAELRDAKNPVELVWAFGGVDGFKGRRNGDIGCEREPVGTLFQLKPEQCRDNRITVADGHFSVQGKPALLSGIPSPGAILGVGNAEHWSSLDALLNSSKSNAGMAYELPLVVGRNPMTVRQPCFLMLRVEKVGAVQDDKLADLPLVFDAAEQHRCDLAGRVEVETPDAFINAAAAALNVAADGVWDEKQSSFMHGAVAWRVRLLGWRGAYAGDSLGWHDRTRRHIEGYVRQQNIRNIPEKIPVADEDSNMARSETALHSNGDMTDSHYDMNLVAMDALFRHLLWTGDLDFARRMWPAIERHLAWERRLFRRPYGDNGLPLYEAYCCIWASDDVAYNGGGAMHSSACNYYHNRMAARVARLIGKDAAPYEKEADQCLKAMQRELWIPEGWFAEYKDWLGLRQVHPNAAAWTFYHAVDSGVPTPREAWQMSRFVESQIARIPVRGPGVPEGCFNMPTSSWMPYSWSVNNVVMAESAHTALAFWQCDRPDQAFPLFKGALLDHMYVGLCPGNVGMCSFYDPYRRESQRDFADGAGALSRAFIEGLFGVKPDALAGELRVRPGFPFAWDHTSLQHPDFTLAFRREGLRETFTLESRFSKPMALRLHAAALRDKVARVEVNGQPARWQVIRDSVGTPRIEVPCPASARHEVVITWTGNAPATPADLGVVARDAGVDIPSATPDRVDDPQKALGSLRPGANGIHAVASGPLGHRTVFICEKQGALEWWRPVAFEIRPAWEIVGSETQEAGRIRFRVRNNTDHPIDRETTFRVAGHGLKAPLRAAPHAVSDELALSADGLLPGSNPVSFDPGDGHAITGTVVNWNLKADAATQFDPIDLMPVFNDRVTRIFQNEYRSPRSPFCSLAIPTQGFGSWCSPQKSFEVNDSGLRSVAAKDRGCLVLPQGVPFRTPSGDARNIAFVSQWDNYPKQCSVPLNGKSTHAWLLMAGSSNPMQSRFDNGEVVVEYADGRTERMALRNPDNWWPIYQDYFTDDFAFRHAGPLPPRVDLKTGRVRILEMSSFKGTGREVPGGAATVLDIPLDPARELRTLTIRALANEVVIGLMSLTLAR
jgi:hypothetical protein